MNIPDHYSGHRIAVVFDGSFGDRLQSLARKLHVWIMKSPENEAAVQKYAATVAQTPDEDPLGRDSGVTIFDGNELTEGLVESIWDHHGEFAHDPPLSAVIVIGKEASQSEESVLAAYGFQVIERQEGAFTAVAAEAAL